MHVMLSLPAWVIGCLRAMLTAGSAGCWEGSSAEVSMLVLAMHVIANYLNAACSGRSVTVMYVPISQRPHSTAISHV
jgi:hypothetical protein